MEFLTRGGDIVAKYYYGGEEIILKDVNKKYLGKKAIVVAWVHGDNYEVNCNGVGLVVDINQMIELPTTFSEGD